MQLHCARRVPAQNVSTRRNNPRPETKPTAPRPRHIAPRLGWDPRRIGSRPRRWGFCPRRDRDETLVRLETVSKTRRLDRDHIPAFYQAIVLFVQQKSNVINQKACAILTRKNHADVAAWEIVTVFIDVHSVFIVKSWQATISWKYICLCSVALL